MSNTQATYPSRLAATSVLLRLPVYGSGIRWIRRESGWTEAAGQAMAPTGRTAEIVPAGRRFSIVIR